MKSARAFTLLEALITSFMVALIFGLLMTNLQEGARVVRLSQTREQAMQAAVVGLERMSCELREAVQLASPNSASAVSDLRFSKIDPSLTNRLPVAVAPATWDPLDPAYLLAVHYSMDTQGRLIREVGPAAGPPSARQVIAEGLTGLSFSQSAPSACNISMSVNKGLSIDNLRMQVLCPCVP